MISKETQSHRLSCYRIEWQDDAINRYTPEWRWSFTCIKKVILWTNYKLTTYWMVGTWRRRCRIFLCCTATACKPAMARSILGRSSDSLLWTNKEQKLNIVQLYESSYWTIFVKRMQLCRGVLDDGGEGCAAHAFIYLGLSRLLVVSRGFQSINCCLLASLSLLTIDV